MLAWQAMTSSVWPTSYIIQPDWYVIPVVQVQGLPQASCREFKSMLTTYLNEAAESRPSSHNGPIARSFEKPSRTFEALVTML